MKKTIYIIIAALCLVSCQQKYLIYDNPYVYIKWSSDSQMSETSTIMSRASATRTYDIMLSSKRITSPIKVYYEIIVGDGLKEGVDFEIEQAENYVTFMPTDADTLTTQDFTRSMNIKFLRNTSIDKEMDNTITIRLIDADPKIQLGLPGKNARNSFHTIRKTK